MSALRAAAALALAAATVGGATDRATEIPAAWLARLAAADIAVLGEVHDNPRHHETQAAIVAAMRPTALVFEMLTPEQAARATRRNRDDPAALSDAFGWAASGWPDFAMYHPIIAAAPAAEIRGAALPREAVARAMAEGAAAAFGPEAARFGLDRPLAADDRAAREAEQAAAHCDALPDDLLPGMVEAQRLRDAGLARAALGALAETGGPVAVITGSGHARNDTGMPALVATAAPATRVVTLGQLEAEPEAPPPHDLWIVTDPAPRQDPCAALR